MHHAYLYEGSLSQLHALETSAKKLFKFSGKTEAADPDVHIYEWEKFTIDDARELSLEALHSSVSGRALYVLGLGSISHDAQQALLKLFEEPQEGVVFVLLTPPGTLIATLRSRFVEYPEKLEESATHNAPAKKFLASSTKDRSVQITALLKEDEGVKERVRDLLNGVESILYKNIEDAKARAGLEEIALVRSYLSDRSASLKMLLEHLAMVLPVLTS